MARRESSPFDFSGVDFSGLGLKAFTGSDEAARPFRVFEHAGDVSGFQEAFEGEVAAFKEGAHERLTRSVAELETTRELTARLFEARIDSLDANVAGVNARLARARAAPKVKREAGQFKLGGKLRDAGSELGLTGIEVEAFRKGDGREEVLARVPTDAEGNFEIALSREEAGTDELFLRFFDPAGETIEESERCVKPRVGGGETLVVDLEAGERLGPAVAAARRLISDRGAREASLKAKLDAVRKERDQSLADLDAEIARRRELLDALERDLPEETVAERREAERRRREARQKVRDSLLRRRKEKKAEAAEAGKKKEREPAKKAPAKETSRGKAKKKGPAKRKPKKGNR